MSKLLSYAIYAVLFIVELISLHLIVKAKSSYFKSTLPLASIVFLLSFPTLTRWSIDVPCEKIDIFGFGCSCSIELTAPIILSSSPVYTILSAGVAVISIKLYAKFVCQHLENKKQPPTKHATEVGVAIAPLTKIAPSSLAKIKIVSAFLLRPL